MFLVQCDNCHATSFTEDGQHLGKTLACNCCPEGHDHDVAANLTGTPCRPVTITLLPGSTSLTVR